MGNFKEADKKLLELRNAFSEAVGYEVNCISIHQQLTTTKIRLKNPSTIETNGTKDLEINLQVCEKFVYLKLYNIIAKNKVDLNKRKDIPRLWKLVHQSIHGSIFHTVETTQMFTN